MAIYGPDGALTEEVINGTGAFVSLASVSAVGSGSAALDNGLCRSNHAMVVTSGAGVTSGSVQLQGSIDGTNWFNLGTAVSTSAASETFAPVVITGQPVRFLRASVVTAISGGTVSAVVASSN